MMEQEWGTYSSFRVLFPPNAIPELQSSLFAQIETFPPKACEIRGKWWTGEGPKRKEDLGIEANGSGRAMVTGAIGGGIRTLKRKSVMLREFDMWTAVRNFSV